MNERFAQLSEEILRYWFETNPVIATGAGVHEYDDKLERLDRDSRLESLSRFKSYLSQLDSFDKDPSDLSHDQRIDLRILQSALDPMIKLEEEYRRVERDATVYPDIALWSVYVLLMREFAPLEERLASALARLKEIPRLLEEGRANLEDSDDIPAAWTRMGIEVAQSGMGFFAGVVPMYASQVKEMHNDVVLANNEAIMALNAYSRWLEGELMEKSKGEYRLGEDLFNYLLKHEHLLDYDCDDLLQIGRDEIDATKKALREAASEIDSDKFWGDLIEELKQDTPTASDLLDTYVREVERARMFVVDNRIVSLPESESLLIRETPEFKRGRYPYAAYVPPAAFEDKQEGVFWVTPVDTNVPEPSQIEQLTGHSIQHITLKAVHEGYPGHHVQLLHANRAESSVRKAFQTSIFAEGWALYCEDMMFEQGFYDLKTRLFQLKDQLWRGCRVIIDVELHRGNMGFQDAARMLVDEAGLEEMSAISEVKRYTQSPTQPMSYTIGKNALLKLRSDYGAKHGKEFRLENFHEKVLSYGTIPVGLVVQDMMNES